MIKIYTDGACSPNPGKGGWGVYIIHPDKTTEKLNGGRDKTTNNQMELMAAIKALAHFHDRQNIKIYTDSRYVQRGITEWITRWKKRGWKTANRKPVINADLWRQLDSECKRHSLTWAWVKGHNGNYGNEKADELAGLYVYGESTRERPVKLSERVSELELRLCNIEILLDAMDRF